MLKGQQIQGYSLHSVCLAFVSIFLAVEAPLSSLRAP